jgi:hypothetical protein
MRGIAILLVALWGILHRIVILGFRNFIAVMVSGVEEEGTRRGTTMCDAIERHCSGVEQAADPEDSLSGVEEPAGEGFSPFPFSPRLLRSYVQHVRFAVETMRNFA